jgi:hypothetical protein
MSVHLPVNYKYYILGAVLLEKLTVIKLVKKSPAFYGTLHVFRLT